MNCSKIMVLAFGHLPREIGGKQTSGLSQVMWRLANEINKLESNYNVTFVSTDIYKDNSKIDQTNIIGWNFKTLLKDIFSNPILNIAFIYHAIHLRVKSNFPLLNTLSKLIFWGNTLFRLEDEIKIVHVHGVNNFAILEKLIKPQKYKVILTIHGLTGNDFTQKYQDIQWKLEEAIIRTKKVNKLIFVTQLIKTNFSELYGNPATPSIVILNGYDPIVFNHKSSEKVEDNTKLNLLIIGVVSELKGQARVLEAISRLPSHLRKKIFLKIIGVDFDNLIPNLLDYSRINNIELSYLGYQEPKSLSKILQGTDYMILPSISEGFGLVYIESIACGVPIIIPKNLPLSHEIDLLNFMNSIKLEDYSIDSIAECLSQLEKWPYSKIQISKTVSHLSWPIIAKQYINLYQSL